MKTETLLCGSCDTNWRRPVVGGFKPARCPDCNPTLKVLSTKVAARRKFSAWFTVALDASDHTTVTLADTLGMQPASVSSWAAGKTLPVNTRLVALADALDVPLTELCDAVGTPRNDALRAAFGEDPDTSLPGMLRNWQDARGYDSSQAGAAVGLSRWNWSRFVCGSTQPGRRSLQLLTATGIDLVTLTDAAWPGDDENSRSNRRWARNWVKPTAQLVRAAVATSTPTSDTLQAAGCAQALLDGTMAGDRIPDVDEAVSLARATSVDLLALLLTAGHDPADASELVGEIRQASARKRAVDGRKIVQQYRQQPYIDTKGVQRKQVAWAHIARQMYGPDASFYRLMKVITGRHHGGLTVQETRALADAIGEPRERMLAGFGHTI